MSQESRPLVPLEYDWVRVFRRLPLAMLMGVLTMLSVHGFLRDSVIRTCDGRTLQALEFLVVFSCTVLFIEGFQWFLWRRLYRTELSPQNGPADGEVVLTGGTLVLAPKGVVASFVFWIAVSIGAGIAGFPDACETPAFTWRSLLSWFAYGYAALALGNIMDAEIRRKSQLPQTPKWSYHRCGTGTDREARRSSAINFCIQIAAKSHPPR